MSKKCHLSFHPTIFPNEPEITNMRVLEVKALLNRSLIFILKHRSQEVLEFFLSVQDITNQLSLHLKKHDISNLLIEIIIQEENLKEKNEIGYEWSTKTNLSGKIISTLITNPIYFYDSLHIFINELVNRCNSNSAAIKSIFQEQNCYLIRYYYSELMADKIGYDPIDMMKYIEEHILDIYFANKTLEDELHLDTEIFSSVVYQTLREETALIEKTINAEDAQLNQIVIGMKYFLILFKRGLSPLIGNCQKEILYCMDICFKYPYANVLHNSLLNLFEFIIANDVEDEINSLPSLICCLLQEGLIKKIINGIRRKEKNNNFRYHLRLISCFLRDSQSLNVKARLDKDPYWNQYVDILNEIYSIGGPKSPELNTPSSTTVPSTTVSIPSTELIQQPTDNNSTMWESITDTLYSLVSKSLSLATGIKTPPTQTSYRAKESNFLLKLDELMTT